MSEPRKGLFDHNDRYTDRANDVCKEAYPVLKKIAEGISAEGYSLRDLMALLTGEVLDVCTCEILKMGLPRNR